MSTTKQASWLTLAQVARELGCSRREAEKHLHKAIWCYPARLFDGQRAPRFDARILDLLRAMRGQPHRTLEPVHSDWLTTYLKEN